MKKKSLFWFRRDLRLHDNRGLDAALRSGKPVIALFIIDSEITGELKNDDPRVSFIFTALKKISDALIRAGSGLLILRGNPVELFPTIIKKYSVSDIYLNEDYEPYGNERDLAVKRVAEAIGTGFHSFKDHVIFSPQEILKKDGTPYTIFTPYSRQWLAAFSNRYGLGGTVATIESAGFDSSSGPDIGSGSDSGLNSDSGSESGLNSDSGSGSGLNSDSGSDSGLNSDSGSGSGLNPGSGLDEYPGLTVSGDRDNHQTLSAINFTGNNKLAIVDSIAAASSGFALGIKSDSCDPSHYGFKRSSIQVEPYNISDSLLAGYEANRNIPSVNGTSLLGPHLRFGTVSIRDIAVRAAHNSQIFLKQLSWREFFIQILYHFPYVVTGSFRKKYDTIEWRNNPDEFERWCNGVTGYPIVDAGMRQLKATGYMHNRVRMITASFLAKHLLIDWRWGEAWFAEHLLDYELASNNGNWQWAAGTGCDASPWFRVFNPLLQQKKFDPAMEYILRWVPEIGSDNYPAPVVEHRSARLRAIGTYKKALT